MSDNISKKLISVIIPVYNVSKYINKCLDSIINQTYENLQIILVDDESTDNSGIICDEYARKDERITVIHVSHKGASAARNEGLKIAEGEYLSFIDADDWVEYDYYDFLAKEMQTKEADAIRCGLVYVANGENIKCEPSKFYDCVVDGKEAILKSLTFMLKEDSFMPGACNFLCKMDLVKGKENNFFDEKYILGEDSDWVRRVLFVNCKRVVLNSKPLYYYNRDNFSSTTHNLSYSIIKEEQIRIINFVKKYLLSTKDFKTAQFLCYYLSLRNNIKSYIIEGQPLILKLDQNFYDYLLFNNKLKNGVRVKMILVYLLVFLKIPSYLLKCAWEIHGGNNV